MRLCPWRPAVLMAKVAVLAGAVLAVGLWSGAVLLVVDLLLTGPGPAAGERVHLLLAGAAQPALVAVLALGVAAAVRSTTGAVSVTLAIFLVLPLAAVFLPGGFRWLPHAAANGMLDTAGGSAAVLLAGRAAAALLLGGTALQMRRP